MIWKILTLMLLLNSNLNAQFGYARRETLHTQGTTEFFEPSASYAQWWKEMEACAGVQQSMKDWKFVVVYADAITASNGALLGGTVDSTSHSIFYIKAITDQKVRVQHEMLHAMLFSAGKPWMHETSADLTFDKCSFR